MKKNKTIRILRKVFAITFFVFLLNAFYFWELNPEYWSDRMPMCIISFVFSFMAIMITEISEI